MRIEHITQMGLLIVETDQLAAANRYNRLNAASTTTAWECSRFRDDRLARTGQNKPGRHNKVSGKAQQTIGSVGNQPEPLNSTQITIRLARHTPPTCIIFPVVGVVSLQSSHTRNRRRPPFPTPSQGARVPCTSAVCLFAAEIRHFPRPCRLDRALIPDRLACARSAD
jgi:hypothetical protein